MRSSVLLSCTALFALSGCIEEPTRVVPVGGFDDDHHAAGHYDAPAVGAADGMNAVGASANATIAALGGSGVSGTVTFTELDADQLRVEYAITGLTPGAHGFHVHENGSCADGPDGTPGGAAGGHYNPGGDAHGGPDEAGDARHVGDFGNIVATDTGVANGSFIDDVARLVGPGGINGKALMVHAEADDLRSQPSGAAGARVGCGVIGR